jgi:hypothetical protein
MKSTGAPSRASALFFVAAEVALASLVRERGWKLNRTKDLCIRIEIHPRAHVDIPLYAISSDQFVLLKRAFDARSARALTTDAFDQEDEDLWANVPNDKVLIAHRTRGWQKSDPRPLKLWFEHAVAQHGQQLRRIVRDVKAYRDFQWVNGGPASLLLMVATVEVFEAHARRDDLALLNVVERLPLLLRTGVAHPVDSAESLTGRLGLSGVEEAAQKFELLATCLRGSIWSVEPRLACESLVERFGERFPNEPHRVVVQPVAPSVPCAAARVRAAAAALVAPAKPWGRK